MEHEDRVRAARILQSCPRPEVAWAMNRVFALDAVREPGRFPDLDNARTRADAACLAACGHQRSKRARLRRGFRVGRRFADGPRPARISPAA